MNSGPLWLNGDLHAQPPLLASDRGLLLGDGLFETVLVRYGAPVLLPEHLQRMRNSALALDFAIPGSFDEQIAEAFDALRVATGDSASAALRVTLTRGPGPRGIGLPEEANPSLLVQLDSFDPTAVSVDSAAIIDALRLDPLDPLAPHKTTSALRWVAARQAARVAGADVALLRTIDGDLAEADFANLFAVIDGRVVTPPLERGVLPGVTRAFVLRTLRDEEELVEERPIRSAEVDGASELFLTSSLVGVRALRLVDGRPLPPASPVAEALAAAYARIP
jgi:branched-chain amino acid aminotransferase